jgi:kinesin family protein 18/19
VAGRTKEKRYTFDIAFEPAATNEDVYNGTVKDLVVGVLYGVNTTVFAYGATGSGKTYTMVGSQKDPGLMILSLKKIFDEQKTLFPDEEFDVTCSYLEVYNEVIYDLLVKNSAQLELREDPEQGAVVAGLQHITVTSAADIMGLIDEGNLRRKTESTDANSVSSRSHAVLEIVIKRQTSKNHYKTSVLKAKLALVDLAGSERASETNNVGQKLRDGANINKSLLALANCINALGKGNSDKNYVPYRNSKLTRLLKDGLSGNSRTAMIATVSASSEQYAHSIGTLKYADRAKEIKTHIVQNVGSVESHIADYQRIIDNLQSEVQDLKVQLGSRSTAAALQRESSGMIPGIIHAASGDLEPTRGSALNLHLPRSSISSDIEVLGLIDSLVQEMNENIEERVNLQKALFEIEDANVFNRYELKQLEEFLEAGNGSVKDITEARNRRDEVLSAVKENDKERNSLKAEISENEGDRRMIQEKIDDLSKSYQNVAFLNLVSTFRLQAVQLQELKFQMAVRDQIIGEQRQVIANLWKILDKSGMGREKVLDIAKSEVWLNSMREQLSGSWTLSLTDLILIPL